MRLERGLDEELDRSSQGIVGLAVEDGYPPFLEWVAASVEA